MKFISLRLVSVNAPMAAVIADQLAQVSIHGLPRVATAKSLRLRIFWLSLFLATTSVFTSHLIMLIQRYLKAPINTSTEISKVDFEFPDVFICNPLFLRETFASVIFDIERNPAIKAIKEKSEELRKGIRKDDYLRKHFNVKKEDENIRSSELKYLRRTYWSSLDPDLLSSLLSKEHSIIRVELNEKEVPLSVFHIIPHEVHHSCFKFNSSSHSKHRQMTLYLYTDNSQLNASTDLLKISSITYDGEKNFDVPSGFKVYILERGEHPGFSQKPLIASPGMFTQIYVSMTRMEKLRTTNNKCSTEVKFQGYRNRFDPRNPLIYRMDNELCFEIELVKLCYKTCGCVPLNYLIPKEIANEAARCLNFTHWSVTRVLKNLKCEYRVMHEEWASNINKIVPICRNLRLCEKNVYSLRVQNTNWPAPNMVEGVIRQYMKEPYDERVREYPNLSWFNVFNASGNLRERMFRENVVKLEIAPVEWKSNRIVEFAAYPLINLLSDIGGILGLYMGMSVLSLAELVESFKVICCLVKVKKIPGIRKSKEEDIENMEL